MFEIMYTTKIPRFVRWPYPELTWCIENEDNAVYLTFDDGPIPEITPWVLDQLKEYNAEATFFMVGENAEREPEIVNRMLLEGHIIGNHTYNHLNGWKTSDQIYFDNIARCQEYTQSNLFRPPYGRIKRSQIKLLKNQYKIVMWDILSGDFDEKLSGEDCVKNIMKNVNSGSIVVFHDSLKAWPRLQVCLPEVLKVLTKRGFNLRAIT